MGLFDKIKTLLYDVEEVEVEKKIPVEESKPASPVILGREVPKGVGVQPDIKRTIQQPKQPEKTEVIKEEVKKEEDVISERDLFKSESTFKFPVVFDEKDFTSDENVYNKNNIVTTTNTKIRQQRLSNNEPKVSAPKIFKPSPIISPVYGILDKNYKKEDLTLVDEKDYEVPRQKKIDFDVVRKKAYGTLVEDLEDTLIMNLKETKKEIEENKEKDLIEVKEGDINPEEMVVSELEKILDEEEIKSDITIGEAHENYSDFGREYQPDNLTDENDITPEVLEPIDISNEEKKPIKKKDMDLTEDLFNLINSMYDEE